MPPQEVLWPPLPNPGAPACSLGPHLAIYVGFGPGDVVVVVDDHGPAEHVQVFHHVLLGIRQCGDLRVVAWSGRGWLWMRGAHPQLPTALGWELPWVRHWVLLPLRLPSPGAVMLPGHEGLALPGLGEPPAPQDLELPWEQQGLNSGHKAALHPPGLSCRGAPHDRQLCPGSFNFFMLESS